jgi:predicted AlkP superfamily pyrophosphatase or phosphodiesterase
MRKQKKLIIIGIDGCRPDALLKADTPNIDSLMKDGAYTMDAITNSCSISGPCWTSMQTGVWHDKHCVLNNEFDNMNVNDFPHIFNYLKKMNPALKTASIANWGPVSTPMNKEDGDIITSFEDDGLVVEEVKRVITCENPDAVFIQLDNMDHVGHAVGYGPEYPEYQNALNKMDIFVGQIVNAVKSGKNYSNEEWLIIVATDHGGIEKRHGGESVEELTIFYILNGKNVIPGSISGNTYIVDIAAIALKYFGVDISHLDGKAHGLKKVV